MTSNGRGSRISEICRLLAALMTIFAVAHGVARAASLEGRVRNGTTNQPVSGAKVEYIQLQQGMAPVASANTDSQGLFRFDGVEAFAGSPALIQVEYQGATYSQPVISPQPMARGLEILIYEASHDPSLVSLREHAIFLRPAGGALAVIEQVFLENNSNPPRTYVNPEGTYTFSLPGKPRDGFQASVVGAAGMPIPQTPTERKQPNSFAITYPIRPGESQVRLEYTLDYQAPFPFTKPLDQPAEQTHIVTRGEGVLVRGENLTAVGKDPTTGFLAYRSTPGTKTLRLQVSGEAPVTQAEAQTAESSEAGGLIEIPDAATERKWLILGALGLIMLVGFVYLYAV